MNRAAVTRGALLLVSTLGALAFAEGAVRLLRPQDLSGWWTLTHPSGLAINRPGGRARHQFRDIVVEYSFGPHHNRQRAAQPARPAARPILLLGDSFTFGWLIRDGLTFAHRLEERFPEQSYVNGAVGGWGTADAVKFVELFCTQLRPAAIYLFMNSFDVDRSANTGLYKLNEDGAIVTLPAVGGGRGANFLNGIPAYGWLIERSHLAALARVAYLSPRQRAPHTSQPDHVTPESAFALERGLLLKMQDEAEACAARLQVFFIGSHREADLGAGNLTRRFFEGDMAARFFEQNGIAFTDLARTTWLSGLFEDPGRYTIANDGHPNERGAERIYMALVEALTGEPATAAVGSANLAR